MNITDLAQTSVTANIEFSGDGVDYWDHTLEITNNVTGEREYIQELSTDEVCQLQDNLEAILMEINRYIGQ